MTDNHPITPPPELVREWVAKNYVDLPIEHVEVHLDDVKICTEAARWGADQELEACCEWVSQWRCMVGGNRPEVGLRAARRPKPPSLKEQALHALLHIDQGQHNERCHIIRRALEQLDD